MTASGSDDVVDIRARFRGAAVPAPRPGLSRLERAGRAMRELRDKTAVVTGAGSGIGRSEALALAREGVHLALLDVDERTLPGVRDEVAALGVRAHVFPLDVSDRAAVLAVAPQVERTCGDVHVLCSNAGVAYRGTGIEDTPD